MMIIPHDPHRQPSSAKARPRGAVCSAKRAKTHSRNPERGCGVRKLQIAGARRIVNSLSTRKQST